MSPCRNEAKYPESKEPRGDAHQYDPAERVRGEQM
jgi:hypothetical protein